MNYKSTINVLLLSMVLVSCAAKIVSRNYYQGHAAQLEIIEKDYKQLYKEKPFSLAFTSKDFTTVQVEIITDTITYIYDFDVDGRPILDTLQKYGLRQNRIYSLITKMKKIRCTWINSFDYYVNDKEQHLIFISIKPVLVRYPLSPPRYYIIAYFDRPQSFDKEGRLLDGMKVKRLRKLNGQVFKKINDRVCYTIAEKYR